MLCLGIGGLRQTVTGVEVRMGNLPAFQEGRLLTFVKVHTAHMVLGVGMQGC